MPGPASRTLTRTARSPPEAETAMCPPFGVKLTALSSRFYDLMRARNPENVSEATWARNDIHFRNLKRLPARTPLRKAQPDRIDRETAAQYRDERAAGPPRARRAGRFRASWLC
jgi:hypothetical protein